MFKTVHYHVAAGMTREVLSGCSNAMWEASGQTTMLLILVVSLYRKKNWKLEEEVLDRTLQRTSFGRGSTRSHSAENWFWKRKH